MHVSAPTSRLPAPEWQEPMPPTLTLKTPGADYAGLTVPLWLLAFLLPVVALVVREVAPWWLMLIALVLVGSALVTTAAKVLAWLRNPQRLQLFANRLVLRDGAAEREVVPESIAAFRWRQGASRFLATLYGALALALALPSLALLGAVPAENWGLRLFLLSLLLMGVAAGLAGLLLWRMGPSRELIIEKRHAPDDSLVIVVPAAAEAKLAGWLGPDAAAVVSLLPAEPAQGRSPRVEWMAWAAMLIPILFAILLTLFG